MNDEIKGAIKHRLSSNILGTFTLSFLALNWKFFVYVFSALDVETKIQKAETIFFNYLLCNSILAILFTLFVLFLIPKITVFYNKYYFKQLAQIELEKHISNDFVTREINTINDKFIQVINTKILVNEILVELQRSSEILKNFDNNFFNQAWVGKSYPIIINHNAEATTKAKKLLDSYLNIENIVRIHISNKKIEKIKFD